MMLSDILSNLDYLNYGDYSKYQFCLSKFGTCIYENVSYAQ